jgi:hypothetical protein
MVVGALLESRFTDVEWEGLLVSCAIWLCAIRADTQVGKGVLVQMSVQMAKSSDTGTRASRKIMQVAKSPSKTWQRWMRSWHTWSQLLAEVDPPQISGQVLSWAWHQRTMKGGTLAQCPSKKGANTHMR